MIVIDASYVYISCYISLSQSCKEWSAMQMFSKVFWHCCCSDFGCGSGVVWLVVTVIVMGGSATL